jgi:hypothetical protein
MFNGKRYRSPGVDNGGKFKPRGIGKLIRVCDRAKGDQFA